MISLGSPLVVAGMHRSGTSLLASLLSTLSVDMGRNLLGPDAHNVRGYFEDVEFLTLQRRTLSECCASDDGGHPDWGWTERDWELWIQAAERGWRFHHLPYLAFDYRVRPGSLLSQVATLKEGLCRQIRKKHVELYWKTAAERVEQLEGRLAAQAAEHARAVGELLGDAAAMREELSVLRERLARYEAEIQRMKASWIWRPRTRWTRES